MFKRSPATRRWGPWLTLSALVLAVLLTVLTRQVGTGADQSPAPRTPVAETPRSHVAPAPPAPSVAAPVSTRPLPGVAPDDSALVGGITNHLEFARRVATLLLAYDAGTDFAARNTDLLRAAAPTPYGDPTGLDDTLAAYTPTGAGLASIKATDTTVTVSLSQVTVSDWAARKLAARGASAGVYGIDIAATQTMTTRDAPAIQVPVRMGLTVACPPAVEFCTVAGVFPQFLEDALGAG